jgi:hypothetical protein
MPRYSKEAKKSIQDKLACGRNCVHPQDQRKVIGFGIFCMKCQCRMDLVSNNPGFISDANAEKKILNDIQKEL